MNVIINADDFGYSENRDNTILDMHLKGVLSSTTMLANGHSFENALKISRQYPSLGIGVHLVLDSGHSLGTGYKTIVDKNTGRLFDRNDAVKKLRSLSMSVNEIYKEYSLQIEKILDHRIKITHLDHHHHLHIYLPSLLAIVKAARRFKINKVRTQRIVPFKSKGVVNKIVRHVNHSYIKLNCSSVDAYFESGLKGPEYFNNEYGRLKRLFASGLNAVEIVLHPRDVSDDEYQFYTSGRVMELLGKQRLIHYGHLA